MIRRAIRTAIAFLIFGTISLAACQNQSLSEPTAPPSDVESFRQLAGGIDYYVERRGSGPPLVMVTSGQGDSGAYMLIADILAKDFTVYTFDPPGFSRSGPPPTWEGMSTKMLGDQVAEFVEALGIEQAHFYGVSSGGMMVLAVAADHPDLVLSAVVHEPALISHVPNSPFIPPFAQFFAMTQTNTVSDPRNRDVIMDPDALDQLGEDHLERRAANRPIWVKRYAQPDVPCCNRLFTREELVGKPLTITVGMFTPGAFTAAAEDVAEMAEADLVWLPTKHFPYITQPEMVASVIKKAAAASQ